MRLQGKVAIVTGAAMGLGRGISLCLAREGADVVVADIAMDAARKTAEEVKALGRKALAVEADVSQPADAEKVVKETINTFGKVDILVNNAAGSRPRSRTVSQVSSNKIAEIPLEVWDGAYEGVFKSQVHMARLVMPHMKAQKSGKIVNISSVAAKVGDQSRMAYSSLKGAVISFTRALAREAAGENINVNCVCPGLIYTPGWQRSAETMWRSVPAYQKYKDPKEIFLRYVERLTAMRREQTPEDIGHAVVFLASDEARNITGQSLNVDGGQVMG
jgi:meso-butanediol dehydrogenase/(S,S)-butanediol dehydrogenase/diacetyl reductase